MQYSSMDLKESEAAPQVWRMLEEFEESKELKESECAK